MSKQNKKKREDSVMIRVYTSTKKLLYNLKIISRETYDELIKRIIKEVK